MAKSKNNKLTGVVVPLGALYTKENSVIGEFPDLVPFAHFCKTSGLSIIQLLPINDTGTQSSPYSGLSAFALHPIYIKLSAVPFFDSFYSSNKKFAKDYDDYQKKYAYSNRYDYDGILNSKIYLLQMLYAQTQIGAIGEPDAELSKFIKSNPWVKTYAVYKNLKWNYMQASWKSWIQTDQHKSQAEIEKLWNTKAFMKEHLFYAWCQMIAAQQFESAVAAVHSDGILLKGDMPILMNEDSCDTWAHPEFFNQDLRAGSPADGENPTGQNWGFPTYNWKNLAEDNYSWWKDRLKNASRYYNAYRLDHILGFFRIWAIPSEDCNALTGHTEPYASFKRADLYELGFDDDRIRWLSQPHIPTNAIGEIVCDYEKTTKLLELICERIGNEELWLFKKNITGSQQIWDFNFKKICDNETTDRVKAKLVEYWANRSLLEVAKNKFIPMWTYGGSSSWGTLNDVERESLTDLFAAVNKKNEKLWKKQADEIFSAITSEIKMTPCGEDLGVGIECVPKTMKEHNILGLRVVRWSRKWDEPGQPYVPFDEYEPLSVTTTSVHDSSTIREWYNNEGGSLPLAPAAKASSTTPSTGTPRNAPEFTPDVAYNLLKTCAQSASQWYINPLQDYLYMNKKYWLPTAEEERINIPGTVTKFNWTWRIPVSIEELQADNELIEKIKEISKR